MTTVLAGDVATIAGRIASLGFADPVDEPLVLPESLERSIIDTLIYQRLTGLATTAVETGRLVVSAGEVRRLAVAHEVAMSVALRIERSMLDVADALGSASVPFAVLKGPAVARSCYPDPSQRSFGDLDLLIHADDWPQGLSAIEELGFERRFSPPRPGFVERFGSTAAHRHPTGIELDLHRTLAGGPFGQWIDVRELFRDLTRFNVGDQALPRLSDTNLLIHALIHAAIGAKPPLLVPLIDVAMIGRASMVAWDSLALRLRRWKLRGVAAFSIEQAESRLALSLPAALDEVGDDASRLERRALHAFSTSRRVRGGPAIETLLAVRGLRNKGSYARAMVLPDREFLRWRTGDSSSRSYVTRLRTPWRWATDGRMK